MAKHDFDFFETSDLKPELQEKLKQRATSDSSDLIDRLVAIIEEGKKEHGLASMTVAQVEAVATRRAIDVKSYNNLRTLLNKAKEDKKLAPEKVGRTGYRPLK